MDIITKTSHLESAIDVNAPCCDLMPWQLTQNEFLVAFNEIIDAGETAAEKIKWSPLAHRLLSEQFKAVSEKIHKVDVEYFNSNDLKTVNRLQKRKSQLEAQYQSLKKEVELSNQQSRRRWNDKGAAMVNIAGAKYPSWIKEGVIKIMPEGSGSSGDAYLTIKGYFYVILEALVERKDVPIEVVESAVSASFESRTIQSMLSLVSNIQEKRERALSNLNVILKDNDALILSDLSIYDQSNTVSVAVCAVLWDGTLIKSDDVLLLDEINHKLIESIGITSVHPELEAAVDKPLNQWINLSNLKTPNEATAAFYRVMDYVYNESRQLTEKPTTPTPGQST